MSICPELCTVEKIDAEERLRIFEKVEEEFVFSK